MGDTGSKLLADLQGLVRPLITVATHIQVLGQLAANIISFVELRLGLQLKRHTPRDFKSSDSQKLICSTA